MVEKHQSTLVLPSATYWFAMPIRGLVESLAALKGITKPMSSAMALVPLSEVTHQYRKSRVAWMSASEAALLTHQKFSEPVHRPWFSSPSTPM